jgi:hypothetical protein
MGSVFSLAGYFIGGGMCFIIIGLKYCQPDPVIIKFFIGSALMVLATTGIIASFHYNIRGDKMVTL